MHILSLWHFYRFTYIGISCHGLYLPSEMKVEKKRKDRNIFKFIQGVTITRGPTHWKKRGMGMCGPKDPLFTPPGCSQDPHFSIFQLSRSILSPQNHKFLEILSSKTSKLAMSAVPKPQIGPKFSSHGYILLRNTVGSQFGSDPFTSPFVCLFVYFFFILGPIFRGKFKYPPVLPYGPVTNLQTSYSTLR